MATFIMLTRLSHQALQSLSSLENLSHEGMAGHATKIWAATEREKFVDLVRYLPPATKSGG